MKRNNNKNAINDNKKKSNLKYLKQLEKDEILLGNLEDIPKYFRHNEYIIKGYRVNCNSISKAFKSLFILHNESVNVWSHLSGAFFIIILICYTSFFITNYKTLLKNVKISFYEIEKESWKLPNLIDDDKLNTFVKHLNLFKHDFENMKSDINKIYISSFITLNKTYNKISNNLQKYFSLFNKKFQEFREKFLDLLEFENITFGRYKLDNIKSPKPSKRLKTWPLFIFLISAIFCLLFSTILHLVGNISINFHRILSRFDYGGVCLLITGSCYPPYYYFFYCEPKYRTLYLTFMTTLGLTTFGLCLTNGFNLPEKRILRGSSFLTFGICSGIPIIHFFIAGEKLKGYNNDIRFLYWYLGGITYVIGAILYLIRFPEKYFPGKFDIFGSSHQLLHIAVLIAIIFHYIGSLDAYYSRFNNICMVNK